MAWSAGVCLKLTVLHLAHGLVYGGIERFQSDPHWRDHILFYEYFHGDNGAGLGASHQTGWTGLVATFIELFDSVDADTLLARGAGEFFASRSQRRLRR